LSECRLVLGQLLGVFSVKRDRATKLAVDKGDPGASRGIRDGFSLPEAVMWLAGLLQLNREPG